MVGGDAALRRGLASLPAGGPTDLVASRAKCKRPMARLVGRPLLALLLLLPSTHCACFCNGGLLRRGASMAAPPRHRRLRAAAADDERVVLVEEVLPLLPAHQYESVLKDLLRSRGEIIRWSINRIDEAQQTAVAEVVLLKK